MFCAFLAVGPEPPPLPRDETFTSGPRIRAG
jgi:hypothetical protein